MAGSVPCHCKGWGHTSLEQAQWEANSTCGEGLHLLIPGQEKHEQGCREPRALFLSLSCALGAPHGAQSSLLSEGLFC